MLQVDITQPNYFLCELSDAECSSVKLAGHDSGARRYTSCLGCDNRESGTGGHPIRHPFKRWLHSHLPITAALLEGDSEAYHRAQARAELEDDIRRRSPACCVYCRAPLIHVFINEKFCPYERAGENQHRRARAQLMGRSK